MKSVAVIIPIYKMFPNSCEEISFRRTLHVLGEYPIIIMCPNGLDISVYNRLSFEERGYDTHLFCESFAPEYFNSIKGYSRLLLSKTFYERFIQYEYILICQLDAYVFRDDLIYWCNKGFDFVGAPWFDADWNVESYLHEGKVGNGGFSLRRVEAFLSYFNGKKHVVPLNQIAKHINFRAKPHTRWFVWLLMAMGWHNSPKSFANNYQRNEDGFWCGYLERTNYELFLPSVQEALEFAWERFPSEIFKKIGHLPFGCHAWKKYEYETFWKQYIQ